MNDGLPSNRTVATILLVGAILGLIIGWLTAPYGIWTA